MALIIAGTFVPTKSPTIGFVWQKMTRDTKDGKLYEKKRRWTIFFNQPHSLNEGDWVTIESEWIDAVPATKLDENGNKVLDTWTNDDGQVIPNIEYQMRAPEVKMVKEREQPKPAVDLDDLAKYGNAPF